jgi:hypothetical protein
MKRNVARRNASILFRHHDLGAVAVPAIAEHIPGIDTVMTYNVP